MQIYKYIGENKANDTIKLNARKWRREMNEKTVEHITMLHAAKGRFLVHITKNGIDIVVINNVHPRLHHNISQRIAWGFVMLFPGKDYEPLQLTPENWRKYEHYFQVRQQLNIGGRPMRHNIEMRKEEMRRERVQRRPYGAYEEAMQNRPSKRRCTGGGFGKLVSAYVEQERY